MGPVLLNVSTILAGYWGWRHPRRRRGRRLEHTCRRGGVALWWRSIHTIMRLRWGIPKTCRVSPHSSLGLGVWRGGNITLLTHPTVIPLSFQSGTTKGDLKENDELRPFLC